VTLAAPAPQAAPKTTRGVHPRSLSPAQIQACLDTNPTIEETWRALGLRNRFQLMRLIKKYGLTTRFAMTEDT
jgi:hypothetical protein